jgi:hypothetical protein
VSEESQTFSKDKERFHKRRAARGLTSQKKALVGNQHSQSIASGSAVAIL